MQHYTMLRRNLIYTGVTRGKCLVVLVGQRKALAMAVQGRQTARRWSKLKERLEVSSRVGQPNSDIHAPVGPSA
jgi:exodeoxyribonuclease V alpha subunit